MMFLCSPRMPWHATHKDASKTSLEGQKRSNIQWHSNNSWHLIAPSTSNNIIQWHYPRSSIGLASAVCVMLPCIAWHVKVSSACLRFCSPFFLYEYVPLLLSKLLESKECFPKKPAEDWSPLLTTAFYILRAVQDSAHHIYIFMYTHCISCSCVDTSRYIRAAKLLWTVWSPCWGIHHRLPRSVQSPKPNRRTWSVNARRFCNRIQSLHFMHWVHCFTCSGSDSEKERDTRSKHHYMITYFRFWRIFVAWIV